MLEALLMFFSFKTAAVVPVVPAVNLIVNVNLTDSTYIGTTTNLNATELL